MTSLYDGVVSIIIVLVPAGTSTGTGNNTPQKEGPQHDTRSTSSRQKRALLIIHDSMESFTRHLKSFLAF